METRQHVLSAVGSLRSRPTMRSKISGGREDGILVSIGGLVRHGTSSQLGVSGRYLRRDVACGPGKSFGLSSQRDPL